MDARGAHNYSRSRVTRPLQSRLRWFGWLQMRFMLYERRIIEQAGSCEEKVDFLLYLTKHAVDYELNLLVWFKVSTD